MGFLGPPPGLLPSMEQPLPMSSSLSSLASDQFPMSGDTKPVLGYMMGDTGFMPGMDMSRLQQEMVNSGSSGHQQDFSPGKIINMN